MSKVFIDTHILVYAFDEADRQKHRSARQVLEKSQEAGNGVISTQVLQEFYLTATKRLGVDPLLAKGLLDSFDVFEIVVISPSLISSAADYQVLSKISFRESLIVAAAESARCESIWTEGFNPGQTIRGIRFENPLSSR